jgi:hypothetical protein
MPRKTQFRIGDRVKLISNMYSDEVNNPKWGGICGKILGTITTIDNPNDLRGLPFHVQWDMPGQNNVYREEDLEPQFIITEWDR